MLAAALTGRFAYVIVMSHALCVGSLTIMRFPGTHSAKILNQSTRNFVQLIDSSRSQGMPKIVAIRRTGSPTDKWNKCSKLFFDKSCIDSLKFFLKSFINVIDYRCKRKMAQAVQFWWRKCISGLYGCDITITGSISQEFPNFSSLYVKFSAKLPSPITFEGRKTRKI